MCPCERSPSSPSPSDPLEEGEDEDARSGSGSCGYAEVVVVVVVVVGAIWSINAGLSGQSINWWAKIGFLLFFCFFVFFFWGVDQTVESRGEVVPQGSNPFQTTSEGPSHSTRGTFVACCMREAYSNFGPASKVKNKKF